MLELTGGPIYKHGNGEFNFTGGTITMDGNRLPWNSGRSWFNVLGSPYTETYDSGSNKTTLYIPPCTLAGTIVKDLPMEVEEADVDGSAVWFSVVLDNAPSATDTITIDIDPNSNGNGVDVTVLPTQLTFTAANWNTPQTVTVKAIDNTWCDGYIEYDKIGFTVTSAESDPSYGCLDSFGVTIIDDDCADIIVSKTDVSVNEGGAGDTYTVELFAPPTSPVTIHVAAGMEDASPTDPTQVPDAFDCQITVNGGGSASLVFNSGNWDTPQVVTVAAVDDSMYEADPHAVTIGNFVDPCSAAEYAALTADNVDVSITENDIRGWSFGDDVSLSLPPNSSFETPSLSEGQSYVNSDPNYGPFGTQDFANASLPISHISDPCWAVMYEVGQSVPDGDNVLVMPGNEEVDIQYLSYTTGPCDYLVEDGPVTYTLTVAVGLPKEAGGAANPDAYAEFEFWVNGGEIASTGDVIAADEVPAGEWRDITLCVLIEADAAETGSTLRIELQGEHVQFDNVRLSVGNHPCPGCYVDITAEEGDIDDDCDVDLADFAIMAGNYLDCILYPDCVTGW